MSKSIKELYESMVAEAGASLGRFFDRLNISNHPEAEDSWKALLLWVNIVKQVADLHDFEQPEWIQGIAGVEQGAESKTKRTGTVVATGQGTATVKGVARTEEERAPHEGFPVNGSFRDQLLFVLKHRGGTGSQQEIQDGYEELGGSAATNDKRKTRHELFKMGKDDLIIKEQPGPSTNYNYWRLKDAPPRPITESKRKRAQRAPQRTVVRHRNNGHTSVPRKPRPEGYNVNAKLRDKLQFIVFSVIRCFAVKDKIVEVLGDYEPGRYSVLSIKQEITNMTRHGLFAKWIFGSDHTYGSPEWPSYEEDDTILSIPNQYKPEGYRDPELELR